MTDKRGRPAPELPIGSVWFWQPEWRWTRGKFVPLWVLSECYLDAGRWWAVVDTWEGLNVVQAVALATSGKRVVDEGKVRTRRKPPKYKPLSTRHGRARPLDC